MSNDSGIRTAQPGLSRLISLQLIRCYLPFPTYNKCISRLRSFLFGTPFTSNATILSCLPTEFVQNVAKAEVQAVVESDQLVTWEGAHSKMFLIVFTAIATVGEVIKDNWTKLDIDIVYDYHFGSLLNFLSRRISFELKLGLLFFSSCLKAGIRLKGIF